VQIDCMLTAIGTR